MTTTYDEGRPHDAVNEMIPPGKLFTLGLQHVLVMYAGAIAVPLIVGRVLQLSSEQVAFLISADLFVCGVVTIIQSLGATKWFGVRLPVMMGVTFASVGPMVSIGVAKPGTEGARMIFGAIIGAGVIAMLIAPMVSRMLRFFPPVVTGTIILVIGVTPMRIGITWIFGLPVGPTAPQIVDPEHAAWLEQVRSMTDAPEVPGGLALAPSADNPAYATPENMLISGLVLATIILIMKYARGFWANISVLMGIVVGGIVAASLGLMHFDHLGEAEWFELITPFRFGLPIFDPIMILTMTLVMIVVMIESTGMFLALSDMCGKTLERPKLSAGLRTDGARHVDRRSVQHLSLHLVQPERGPRRRDRRPLALCLRDGRGDYDRARSHPEDGRAGRGAARGGAGRRGAGHVRNGRGHRGADPRRRGLQGEPLQRIDRGDLARRGNDPAHRAAIRDAPASPDTPAHRQRHSARLDRRSVAERRVQRHEPQCGG